MVEPQFCWRLEDNIPTIVKVQSRREGNIGILETEGYINGVEAVKYYNKLVRDHIPDIIQKGGKSCQTRTLSDEEYMRELVKKLQEEVDEFTVLQCTQLTETQIKTAHTHPPSES